MLLVIDSVQAGLGPLIFIFYSIKPTAVYKDFTVSNTLKFIVGLTRFNHVCKGLGMSPISCQANRIAVESVYW